MKSLILGAVLLMAAPAFAVCESVYAPHAYGCYGHPLIQTQCWPPSTRAYAELLDGYNLQDNHVKLTCGPAYLYGYTHVPCYDLNQAAAKLSNNCCGSTYFAIVNNCPGETVFFTDYMP